MKNNDLTPEQLIAEASRIADALHSLDDRAQANFLFTLVGTCIVSSPESILSAREFAYGDLKENLDKALDATA